jgi:hypothetical protein
VWIGATVPPVNQHVSFIVQLADVRGRFSFEARGESLLLRALQVEFGRYPSPYRAPVAASPTC